MDETMPGIAPDLSTETSRHFWQACIGGRLEMPRCLGCGALRWYPQPVCPYCHTRETEWVELSGRATLFAHTRVHRAFHPGVAGLLPLVSILAQPEEDRRVRFVSRLVDFTPEAVRIGMDIRVVFHRLSPEVNMPLFQPALAAN